MKKKTQLVPLTAEQKKQKEIRRLRRLVADAKRHIANPDPMHPATKFHQHVLNAAEKHLVCYMQTGEYCPK